MVLICRADDVHRRALSNVIRHLSDVFDGHHSRHRRWGTDFSEQISSKIYFISTRVIELTDQMRPYWTSKVRLSVRRTSAGPESRELRVTSTLRVRVLVAVRKTSPWPNKGYQREFDPYRNIGHPALLEVLKHAGKTQPVFWIFKTCN